MTNTKYKFQKLTPTRDVNMGICEDALNFAFDNPDIKNIAISGPYGSGKSSLIYSYEKANNTRSFMHISLAYFEEIDAGNNKKSLSDENFRNISEAKIEGKIINQLIHQIPSKQIPQTNFKVKKEIEPKKTMRTVVGTVSFLICLLHIKYFEAWSKYINALPSSWVKNILVESTSPYSILISSALCISFLGVFLFWIINVQKNRNILRKVKFQGNEIEIFEECKESYFDKYLNEVLYLFENAKVDAIVFEDIDRFNMNKIFERLHEISTLVNTKLGQKGREPLRFLYLLRDDIFISKDRTKFFDYIIPVVPVMDSSNSYNQLIKHFKESEMLDLFDRSFLQGLSLYVDDMRILKNIYNEFLVYYNHLEKIEPDCNKMLAMITYKNLFPKDFSDLQFNKGLVFNLFRKKSDFIENEINRFNSEKDQKKQRIDFMQNEIFYDKQEIQDAFQAKLNRTSMGKARDEVEKERINRIKSIEDKLNGHIQVLENEIKEIDYSIQEIRNRSLKDIISRENIDDIFKVTAENEVGMLFDFNEVKGSEYFDLLKYLIREGFIDETYTDYMTYFYENSISLIDKTFLRSITDKKAKDYTYKLKDPKVVISRLRVVDFDQEEALNFDLLEYLLKNIEHESFLKRLINQLKDTENIEFFGLYLNTKREVPAYIKYINLSWPELFEYVLNKSDLTETQIRDYSIYTLYYSNDEEIQAINKNNSLTQYIADSADYLNIENPDTEKLIGKFSMLNVSFAGINYESSNKKLFQAVYENSLYEINYDNIVLMLKVIYSISDDVELIHKNYTIVCSNRETALFSYLNENIEQYVDVILANCNQIIADDETTVISLLNNDELSKDKKIEYLTFLKTNVSYISEVEDSSLWSTLLELSLADYTVENILRYFSNEENKERLSETLVEFINSRNTKLDFNNLFESYGEEAKEEFFEAVLMSDSLVDSKYKEILNSIDLVYEIFDIKNLSKEKLEILIDNNIIIMNEASLKFMRESYSSYTLNFIAKNTKEYIEIMSSEIADEGEILEVIKWNLDDDDKISLLEFVSESISVFEKSYSSTVKEYILNNNLDEGDIPKLFLNYTEYTKGIRAIATDLAIERIQYVAENIESISIELLKALFVDERLRENQKIDLLVYLIPHIDKDTMKDIFDILELGEYSQIFEAKSDIRFEVNSNNENLLNAFLEANIINEFEKDEDDPEFYKVKMCRVRTKSKEVDLV